MYHFKMDGLEQIGWANDKWSPGWLHFGILFDGNGSNRDDIPFPFLPDGQPNPEYDTFCDELGCASFSEISVNV